jgi:hypothetical protein
MFVPPADDSIGQERCFANQRIRWFNPDCSMVGVAAGELEKGEISWQI